MDAEKLAKLLAKSGKSARSLSLALGKDASYVSSMIARGYGISDPALSAKAAAFLKGEDITPFQFAADDFSSERLSRLIEKHRVSVDSLAERIGVSRATVYKWAQGKGSPRSESVAQALASELRVSIDYLFGFSVEDDVEGLPESKAADGTQMVQGANDGLKDFRGLTAVFLRSEVFDQLKSVIEKFDPDFVYRRI